MAKLITSYVDFVVKTDVSGVNPPFVSGKRDGFWVQTRGYDEEMIRKEAQGKARLCYGMEIEDIQISNQFESAMQ